ncbi:MAG: D-alanyl-D-alanine carboxypeptidase family protein [Limnochordia bacterium]|jgi:D-alanyl-D-alanine carboxypeptidase (penicillin-binding protein 5/6)
MVSMRTPLVIGLLLTCLCFSVSQAAVTSDPKLTLTSAAAVLMDYHTGRVLYEKNAHEPLPPASVTKVMTLSLALEALRDGKVALNASVPTSELAASMGGTQIWLETGEKRPFEELLYAIAVGSANDAAVAVGEFLAGSEPAFVALMNARAKALGMKNTHFANPSGLPFPGQRHVSSAYDLAVLSRYALDLPVFRELVATWGPVVMRPEGKRQPELWSLNKMMKQYPGMDGIKTGMTNEAGFCLAATAERDSLRLIAVTMNAPTSKERNQDIARLLDHGFAQLRAVMVAKHGEEVGAIPVSKGQVQKVAVGPVRDVILTVGRTEEAEVQTEITVPKRINAPIGKGQAVAELIVKLNGKEVTRTDLIALESVARGSLLQIMLRTVRQITGGQNSNRH